MSNHIGLLSGLGIGVAAVMLAVVPVQAFDDQDPGWQALSPAELEAQRAKGPDELLVGPLTIQDNTIQVDGSMGLNTIDSSAFSGAMGMFNVLQNNGHGAILSNAVAVEITMNPGPAP